MRNYQSLCHVIDLKLDIETSLSVHQHRACSPASSRAGLQHAARSSILMNIYAQAAGVLTEGIILQ